MLDEIGDHSTKVVGLKQSRRLIESGEAVKVYLASDVSEEIRVSFEQLCHERQVPLETTATMEELGSACGIDVGAAVVTLY